MSVMAMVLLAIIAFVAMALLAFGCEILFIHVYSAKKKPHERQKFLDGETRKVHFGFVVFGALLLYGLIKDWRSPQCFLAIPWLLGTYMGVIRCKHAEKKEND